MVPEVGHQHDTHRASFSGYGSHHLDSRDWALGFDFTDVTGPAWGTTVSQPLFTFDVGPSAPQHDDASHHAFTPVDARIDTPEDSTAAGEDDTEDTESDSTQMVDHPPADRPKRKLKPSKLHSTKSWIKGLIKPRRNDGGSGEK